MKPITVWFNQHFSNTWQSIALIRRFQRDGELVLGCSHIDGNYPGKNIADFFVTEPRGIPNDEYVDFCLQTVQNNSVDVFWPWRRIEAIYRSRERFDKLGVKLIIPSTPVTFELLQSKAHQYLAAGSSAANIPEHATVRTVAEFENAVERLGNRHRTICYKPAISMFGWGFRIIHDAKSEKPIFTDESLLISLEQARAELHAKEPFKDLLVMPLLPGPERSVDCLADHGKLVRCIIRKKNQKLGNRQFIEHNEQIRKTSRGLVEQFKLNGVVNVQFRDYENKPYLLEINPRMSGGVPYCDVTGVHLPYWAIRLAAGNVRYEDIPYPKTNMEIDTAADIKFR